MVTIGDDRSGSASTESDPEVGAEALIGDGDIGGGMTSSNLNSGRVGGPCQSMRRRLRGGGWSAWVDPRHVRAERWSFLFSFHTTAKMDKARVGEGALDGWLTEAGSSLVFFFFF